ncbi:MAG: hypothetical protein IAG10_12495 [Planctomycetaceae bacterium]|nr:hypothetical protein [Planctomycetaceae bacterium]
MSVLLSPQEPVAMDRYHPPTADVNLAAPGDEFAWDFTPREIDVSDLEYHPLLASDLPLNSELQSMQTTTPL